MTYTVKLYFQDSNNSYYGSSTTVNGGSITINGISYSGGETLNLTDSSLSISCSVPSSSGYNFYQWRYSLNGGSSTSTSSNQTLTLSPQQDAIVIIWCRVSGISYTITYDYNYPNGSSGSSSSTFTYGRSTSLRSSISQSGYTFIGWTIDGEVLAPGSTFYGPASNITAVGTWSQGTTTQYSIYYFDNNSSGTTSYTSSLNEGAKVALKTPSSNSGQQFLGWEIEGTLYQAGASITMPGHDIRANGRWQGVEITVYFNSNGGTPQFDPIVIHSGESFSLPNVTPSKPSSGSFSGWYLNSSYYKAGESVTITVSNSSPTTLTATAQYSSSSSITVRYSVSSTTYGSISGSTSATKTVPGVYGEFPSVIANGDYVFAGWYDRSGNLNSRKLTPSSEIAYYNTHTVYANFYMPQTFRVYPNGGTWSDGSTDSYKTVTFKHGDTYSFPSVTRDGYGSPLGFYTTSNIYGGVEYREGDICDYKGTSTSYISIYARWPQEVTFNGNNGTPSTQKLYYPYGNTYSPLAVATREGYSLLGWFTSSSGGTQVTTSTYVTTSTSRTLYAQWTVSSQTVTFNPNYSGGTSTTQTYSFPGTYTNLPTIERQGFVFQG